MTDTTQTEFNLEPDNTADAGYRDAPPIANGRPKGSKNKLNRADPVWKMARSWTPKIVEEMCIRAARLADELDIHCAQLILSRTWRVPRSAPIQIDIAQISIAGVPVSAARQRLADRLARVIESRRSAAVETAEVNSGGGNPEQPNTGEQDAPETLDSMLKELSSWEES